MGKTIKLVIVSLLLSFVGYLVAEMVKQFLMDARNAQG